MEMQVAQNIAAFQGNGVIVVSQVGKQMFTLSSLLEDQVKMQRQYSRGDASKRTKRIQ